ncbi:hypothetical protein BWD162_006250 [Bartonella sp. WD16.2]|nr:hypothetical protein BWD162_006250 [Bartonella sp. WD16.2]
MVSFQYFIQLIQHNASLSLWSFISFLFFVVTSNNIAYSQTQSPLLTGYVNDVVHFV